MMNEKNKTGNNKSHPFQKNLFSERIHKRALETYKLPFNSSGYYTYQAKELNVKQVKVTTKQLFNDSDMFLSLEWYA
jgi:hypothetical protein